MYRNCKAKFSRYSHTVKRRRNILTEECKGLSPRFCRNPFMVFLKHFRKSFKCPYSCYESAVVAAQMWNEMGSIERKPYVKFATNYQYTCKPKRPKIRYVVNKIRELLNKEYVDLHTLWRLCATMAAWNDRVIDVTLCMDDELNDCPDEEMEI